MTFPIEYRTLKPRKETLLRVDDWSCLPTATVEIRQHGTYVRTAVVEEATADSRMLWLSPNGVEPRMLIDKRDGYQVWIDPEQHYYYTHDASSRGNQR